ncbi:DUF2842 domain-containing protein [Maritimibacter fusiformis]|uniref:DUF2842 domain-containing protein n=1 Tax=Maritimibacter fusiformis TaxID=2603819 RepID=A0A5D0RKC0_9RHOB|nr:DUF2842 domain-containing protein [Maritimibacter fusiformis]TYB80964.1 DUF2842 domain-containing protein [Maritimibacter fusiformis]
MALSLKARKRLSILVLLVGLPIYIILAVGIVAMFDRPPMWLELGLYIVLGFLWMLPLRKLFLGVARAEQEGDDEG